MHRLVASMLFALLVISANAQDIRATTEDGRSVILREGGTWEFVPDSVAIEENPATFEVSPNAKSILATKVGAFNVHYDANLWLKKESDNPTIKTIFEQENGELYAIVVVERAQVSLDGLKAIVLKNAQSVAPESYIERQEFRNVNGTRVLCLRMHVPAQQAAFTFYGYYYTDKRGSVQVLTYTYSNLFDEHRDSMTEFLNGFVVTNQ